MTLRQFQKLKPKRRTKITIKKSFSLIKVDKSDGRLSGGESSNENKEQIPAIEPKLKSPVKNIAVPYIFFEFFKYKCWVKHLNNLLLFS